LIFRLVIGNKRGYIDAMTDILKEVAERGAAIDKEIEVHLSAIKALEAERSDLQTTLKTLAKLGIELPKEPATPTPGEKKTAPEMIVAVLRRDFPNGAEPTAILNRIRERFDPDADANTIRPTVWRMGKEGRLEKVGDKYRLPIRDTEATEFRRRL
jgi:hypothetical protein